MNLRWLVAIIVLPIVTGCAQAVVRSFQADPILACLGTPIAVSWDTDSTIARIDQVPVQLLFPVIVPAAGHGGFTLDNDTILTITATRTTPISTSVANGTARVNQFRDTVHENINTNPVCSGGNIVWSHDVPSDALTSRLIPYVVLFHIDRRPLTISHQSVAAVVTDSGITQTSAFAVTRLAGHWTVSVPLGPGDRCPTSGTVLPGAPPSLPALVAYADASCSGGPAGSEVGLPNIHPPSPAPLPPGAPSASTCSGRPASASTREIVINVRNQVTGCADSVTVYADSMDEAQGCVTSYIAAIGGGAEIVTDMPPIIHQYACTTSGGECTSGQTIAAFSDEDADMCERSTLCTTGTVTPGPACPAR